MSGELSDRDEAVRAAVFEYLRDLCRAVGEELPWAPLERGLSFEGHRIPLLSQQGIFKPAVLALPISIRTAPPSAGPRPYQDEDDADGLLSYCYRSDPNHPENRGLRECMQQHKPLVYFFGLDKGWYRASWPAYVVGDSPARKRFQVAIDDELIAPAASALDGAEQQRRRYITRQCVQRLHQEEFRARVLRAYNTRCSVCSLRHRELLDAAHILADKHPRGDPLISNGLSLCKIHHAAFDHNILGIRPDTVIEIRADILEERDGPMLRHGLQALNGASLRVPKAPQWQPDPERLAERYAQFRNAS